MVKKIQPFPGWLLNIKMWAYYLPHPAPDSLPQEIAGVLGRKTDWLSKKNWQLEGVPHEYLGFSDPNHTTMKLQSTSTTYKH